MTDSRYETRAPSGQTAIDACAGEWLSAFPPQLNLQAGALQLATDARVRWFLDVLGDLKGRSVIEIGPLEGMHTAMLCQAGANVVAVEANRRAWLRCLVTKEVLGLPARFLCGDGMQFLETCTPADVTFALGVLYHQQEPLRFLRALCRSAPIICLTTHYDDPAVETAFLTERRAEIIDVEGMYAGRAMVYRDERDDPQFCGGAYPYAVWLQKDDILAYIVRCGYRIRSIGNEDPQHPLAPAFSCIAERV